MINDTVFSDLLEKSERRKAEVAGLKAKRSLFAELSKPRNLHVGLHGLRGTGKTTLLLQIAREREGSVYVNAEELAVRGISLLDFSAHAVNKGFGDVFIDEIHFLHSWPLELKIMFDRGIRNVFFSGSSGLAIQEHAADLSRRALLFRLPPLSFREFLEMNTGSLMEPLLLEDIIDFEKRRRMITSLLPNGHRFSDYMRFGCFPFWPEHKEDVHAIYMRMLERIVRIDLASLARIDAAYIETVYKLLNTIALSPPDGVSCNFLANQVKRNVPAVEAMILNLTALGLISAVRPFTGGASMVRKEYKYLLAPPFRFVIAKSLGWSFEQVIGGVREDLFVSNTYALAPLYIKTQRERKTPDYRLGNLNFELGPHKYKHETDFYVKDELIIDEKVIPLPIFCMLY